MVKLGQFNKKKDAFLTIAKAGIFFLLFHNEKFVMSHESYKMYLWRSGYESYPPLIAALRSIREHPEPDDGLRPLVRTGKGYGVSLSSSETARARFMLRKAMIRRRLLVGFLGTFIQNSLTFFQTGRGAFWII